MSEVRTYASEYDLAGRRIRLTRPDGFLVARDHLVTGEPERIRETGATSGVGVLPAPAAALKLDSRAITVN